MAQEVTPDLLKNIYPLNKLTAEELVELQTGLRRRFVRTGRTLYEIGESPMEYFYVLDGSMQLVNEAETEFTSVTSASGGESIPLPYFVPAMERAYATTDCDVLAVKREVLDRIIHSAEKPKTGAAPDFHGGSTYNRAGAPHWEQVESEPEPDPWGSAAPPPHRRESTPIIQPQPKKAPPPPLAEQAVVPVNGWQRAMLNTTGYQRVPPDKMKAAFDRMVEVKLLEKDILVEQGEPADYYYVIAEGHCEVVHFFSSINQWKKVNQYGPGGTIGEDALISNLPRNASVRMTTPGVAMRLDGDDFRSLIKPYLARPLQVDQALQAVAEGAQWLDVRMPNEIHGRKIDGAVAIPHAIIRAKLLRVDPTQQFIVVCAEGHDAPVIAFMLCKYGLNAFYVPGGIGTLPKNQIVPA